MTWTIHGMLVIPSEPKLQMVEGQGGTWFNFTATTQGRNGGSGPVWQYWECSMFVPTNLLPKWQDRITPGQVFQVEYAEMSSLPILDGKYHKTKVKLDIYKIKHLTKPMWTDKNDQ